MHFSIARMLLAVTAFAIAFGAFSYLGIAGAVVSTVIGMSVGLICLIVNPNQIWPMIRTGLITIFGGVVGLVFYFTVHSPYLSGGELVFIGVGGMIGFVIGSKINALQQRKPETLSEDKPGDAV